VTKYTLAELPSPPGATTVWAWALNEDGDAAGLALGPGGGHAVLWEESGVTVLDTSESWSSSFGVSGPEVVVGVLPFDSPTHAFLWKNGQMKDIHSALGGAAQPESVAGDVNDAGLVVGSAGPIAKQRPYLYDSQSGDVEFLDPLPGHAMAFGSAVNGAGHALGTSLDANWADDHVFLYANGQMQDRGAATWARGLNASDTIVGSKIFPGAPTTTAYRQLAGGDFENLGLTAHPGYKGSHGLGVNDEDVVVGHSFNSGSTPFRAFVDFPKSKAEPGWHDLQNVTVNAAGWVLESASDINNSGQIVGYGSFQGQTRAFLLTPIPENDPFQLKPIDDYAIQFIKLFGGVAVGGGGWGILPGGKPIPIDPEGWKRLSQTEKDLLVAFALRKAATLLDDEGSRGIIERAGTEVIHQAIAALERRMK
jgi:probable HAF family extracellular repeat protein